MISISGIAVVIIGLLAWLGQCISFAAPATAIKLGLLESKSEMDEVFYILEARALALNDMLFSWMLPLSGLLMLLDHSLWPYLGLVGGGIYLYFSGLIVFSRLFLKRGGKKIGSIAAERTAYVFSLLCSVASMVMISLAISHLTEAS